MKALNMCLRLAHLVRCSLSLGIPEINPGCVCWIGGVSPFLLAIKIRKIWRHHKVYVVFYIFYRLLFSLDVHRLCLAFLVYFTFILLFPFPIRCDDITIMKFLFYITFYCPLFLYPFVPFILHFIFMSIAYHLRVLAFLSILFTFNTIFIILNYIYY